MCNFWSILCNSRAIGCQLLLTKANSSQPGNIFFRIARSLPKTDDPDKKSYTQTPKSTLFLLSQEACRKELEQWGQWHVKSLANCINRYQTASIPKQRFSPLSDNGKNPLSRQSIPTKLNQSTNASSETQSSKRNQCNSKHNFRTITHNFCTTADELL